jgi:type VI secretion system protein ImpK
LEIARSASSDADVRELIGVAVLLGFDKRSLGSDDSQIEQVFAQLAPYQQQKGAQPLSPDWKSAVGRRTALSNWLPFWVSLCVFAGLLAVLFFVLELSLGVKSDQVYAGLAALNVTRSEQPQPASSPRLAGVLTGPNLLVRDDVDRSYIVVPDAKLFEPGGAVLLPDSNALLRSIATTLQGIPGRIQIIGHTDRTLDRSARYPSDWDLSVDRARAVRGALRDLGIPTPRMRFDGRGSIEPLRRNDPARALGGDGRIEIVLLVGR